MRTIRTMMLLALAAIAAVAFAIPAVASANWNESGVAITESVGKMQTQWSKEGTPLTSEATITLGGSLNHGGGADCTATSGALTLNPGSTGGVTEFAIVPSSCTVTSSMRALGCTKVASVSANSLPWSVKAVETGGNRNLEIEGVSLTYKYEGTSLCSKGITGTLSGNATAIPNNSGSISSLSLSGTMMHGGTKVAVSGTQIVKPAGQYGITSHVVGGIALNGTVSAAGGFNCPLSGQLILEPGTKGKVGSMEQGACGLTGANQLCGGGAEMTPVGMPWAVQDQAANIKINVEFLLNMGPKCGIATYKGELLATPDKTTEISNTILSGKLTSSGGTNYTTAGNLGWNPAGKYGL